MLMDQESLLDHCSAYFWPKTSAQEIHKEDHDGHRLSTTYVWVPFSVGTSIASGACDGTSLTLMILGFLICFYLESKSWRP